uniref:Senescence domain-containing protein n=1 Tax=Kalanchoe fedtschenkoi TaxID=63787 RepID=A0A7N0UX61_KALFE
MSTPGRQSLYPEVNTSNPDALRSRNPNYSSMYPTVEMEDLAENLFADSEEEGVKNLAAAVPVEEVMVSVRGAIVHLIDKERSVELASGDLTVMRLRQGENVVAVLARVGDEIQWPLAKDEAVVKLDESHYFFTLHVPSDDVDRVDRVDEVLSYGVTIAAKGQEEVLREFDEVLGRYGSFSVQKVEERLAGLGGGVAREMTPEEMGREVEKRELMRKSSAAYWTTLAPNVEDYSGCVARMIAAGSGQVIRGILWCGDVTVDRLNWGNEFLKKRLAPGSASEISPETMKRIRRVKKLTKATEKMATGVLSGVVKVSGFFTSSVVNSKVGKKFFSLLPGEIVLASLDGFNKVCEMNVNQSNAPMMCIYDAD